MSVNEDEIPASLRTPQVTPEVMEKFELQAKDMMPRMEKQDILNLHEDEQDDVFFASEELAFEWIECFMADVDRVEKFFKEKEESLINDFIATQERFRLKAMQFEDKKKTKKKNSAAGAEADQSFDELFSSDDDVRKGSRVSNIEARTSMVHTLRSS
jgi:hypothetical protein